MRDSDMIGFPLDASGFQEDGVLLVLGLVHRSHQPRVGVHPLAFIAFFVIGGTFLAAGILAVPLFRGCDAQPARDSPKIDRGAN